METLAWKLDVSRESEMRRLHLLMVVFALVAICCVPRYARGEDDVTSGGCWVWPAGVSPEREGKPLFESDGRSRNATLRLEGKVTSLRLAENVDPLWWTSDRLEARFVSRKISVDVKLIADPCPPEVPEGACEGNNVHGTLTIHSSGRKQALKVSGACGT